MSSTCSIHRRNKNSTQKFGWKISKEQITGDLDISKGKVVPVIKHCAMKMHVGTNIQLSTFLNMALEGACSVPTG
jgi:hypothetical protein